jgi:DNA-binding transcriptional regulator YdaS (Cro superfamily)
MVIQETEENTRFRTWVYKYGGTEKLSKALAVHQNSVQNWIAGRSRPNLDAVLGILRLSVGEISLKDIDEGTKPK